MKLPPFKLERHFAKYEFSVPYLLSTSDCESISIQELLAFEPLARDALYQLRLGYTDSRGDPQLRREIANLYHHLTPENILVHTGAEEAIFNWMNVALSADDHVIIHYPAYQSLFEVAKTIGCEVTYWVADEQNNWELDLNFLKRTIKKKTKAIIVNCPHNPTGYVMSSDKFWELIALVKRYNLLLFSDEVYRGLEYQPADQLPAAADCYEKAFSLGVMSKAYGLAGLRIGWLATKHDALYQAMAGFKDYTTICNSAPSEFLATVALRHQEQLVQRNLAIIRHNLARLRQFFVQYASFMEWIPPTAGAIAFPKLCLDIDAEQFCLDLVKQQGVLLLPGNYFDFDHRHFRIGFGRKNMAEALTRLETYLSQNFG